VGNERVLDLTCGSGVFLVEALRRLIRALPDGAGRRDSIRRVLYEQLYGVDLNEAAIRVAAFSLYLAAMELDPGPLASQAWTPFEPLVGRNLHVANVWDLVPSSEQGALIPPADIIVGNPPWTFRGSMGTSERRRQRGDGPRSARGEALDFLRRSIAFSHETTKFGVVLSASQFFSATGTTAADRHDLVSRLSPVTIVNLSALTDWLFETASAPAVVLFGRCHASPRSEVTVVNVPWSPAGPVAHTFTISPSDISTIDLLQWQRDPRLLKFAAFGRGVDAALMDRVAARHKHLGEWLQSRGFALRDGLNVGSTDRQQDATHLLGLPVLSGRISSFHVGDGLPAFTDRTAERPRSRETFRGPLLLIKETVLKEHSRPTSAISEHDLVFTDNYFGASLPGLPLDVVRILAGVISSSFASWYFLLTSADFGVSKRRLFKSDVEGLFIPDPELSVEKPAGRLLARLVAEGAMADMTQADWHRLDNAVFDLFDLPQGDRIIVNDGFQRSTWQWAPRKRSASQRPSDLAIVAYAKTFINEIAAVLASTGNRAIRAEILGVRASALNVVRFVLVNGSNGGVEHIPIDDDLNTVLERIGTRLGTRLGDSLIGDRDVRVYGDNEIIIIKPAQQRHWMRSNAIADAGAVLADSFTAT
jgi:hypothetical protein